MKLSRGLVQVYTGNGKGKTTASLGLAFRAVGRELEVCIVQFMKGGGDYGEHLAAERLFPNLTIHRTGRDGWVKKGDPHPEDVAQARLALDLAHKSLACGKYDLVILDEINGAAWFELVTVDEILALIAEKPEGVELVLTGRSADQRVMDAADLVTEMREVKHYFAKGVQARVGIEM
ncbi:MAG TPA: cob(I)yrinic acid a,c-diamide adenosyltransferase [Geomonas sp.]|nr:cob(I)yrinic acid a,c-diamide adenosyltransferase [Geomonas sp.]